MLILRLLRPILSSFYKVALIFCSAVLPGFYLYANLCFGSGLLKVGDRPQKFINQAHYLATNFSANQIDAQKSKLARPLRYNNPPDDKIYNLALQASSNQADANLALNLLIAASLQQKFYQLTTQRNLTGQQVFFDLKELKQSLIKKYGETIVIAAGGSLINAVDYQLSLQSSDFNYTAGYARQLVDMLQKHSGIDIIAISYGDLNANQSFNQLLNSRTAAFNSNSNSSRFTQLNQANAPHNLALISLNVKLHANKDLIMPYYVLKREGVKILIANLTLKKSFLLTALSKNNINWQLALNQAQLFKDLPAADLRILILEGPLLKNFADQNLLNLGQSDVNNFDVVKQTLNLFDVYIFSGAFKDAPFNSSAALSRRAASYMFSLGENSDQHLLLNLNFKPIFNSSSPVGASDAPLLNDTKPAPGNPAKFLFTGLSHQFLKANLASKSAFNASSNRLDNLKSAPNNASSNGLDNLKFAPNNASSNGLDNLKSAPNNANRQPADQLLPVSPPDAQNLALFLTPGKNSVTPPNTDPKDPKILALPKIKWYVKTSRYRGVDMRECLNEIFLGSIKQHFRAQRPLKSAGDDPPLVINPPFRPLYLKKGAYITYDVLVHWAREAELLTLQINYTALKQLISHLNYYAKGVVNAAATDELLFPYTYNYTLLSSRLKQLGIITKFSTKRNYRLIVPKAYLLDNSSLFSHLYLKGLGDDVAVYNSLYVLLINYLTTNQPSGVCKLIFGLGSRSI